MEELNLEDARKKALLATLRRTAYLLKTIQKGQHQKKWRPGSGRCEGTDRIQKPAASLRSNRQLFSRS